MSAAAEEADEISTMVANESTTTTDEKCASCGIPAGGEENAKLKNCTACRLVKYCGVVCQRNHRPQHKRACKKRAAELNDELLFKQPESTHLGDCPICLLPIPLHAAKDPGRYNKLMCCSKLVCFGCSHANLLREEEARLRPACPFCRTKLPETKEEGFLYEMKRVQANDPVALLHAGIRRFDAGDYSTAFGYWEKAAELGDVESHFRLSVAYSDDEGRCAEKDMKKFIHHSEQAAIGGHVFARHNLASWELKKGNIERAVKHFIIAANLGYDSSLENLKKGYAQGKVSKEDFAAALRAHQAAVDATKSPQRDAAEVFRVMYPDMHFALPRFRPS